eukprot:TRINITY_DN105527_c0_g1_i1.p1 TRINITY_DN105527_c0_g1~~TRINITY_DN105527_c0_g1_i1.p1  ORF type:complete len:581 (+),score=65.23 TRINITY_DN105527_c0_g1_i1:169-1743(+)
MDATTRLNTSICIFEQLDRVGGRVASQTHAGPKTDLVVEPGAYRFAPKKFCIRIGTRDLCIWTPMVGAIIEALQLNSRHYNPNSSDFDYHLYKIVDQAGHDAGFVQYIWGMLHQAQSAATANHLQMHVFLGHSLESLSLPHVPIAELSSDRPPVLLNFRRSSKEHLEVAARQSVLLNLPQQPLLNVLSASFKSSMARNYPSPLQSSMLPPVELHKPNPAPYLKLYLHYSDAWWRGGRYGLNLTSGRFSNLNVTSRTVLPGSMHDPMHQFPGLQSPAPLEGSYHDGDVRCSDISPDLQHCRGYIQAQYSDDFFALMFYRSFGVLNFGEAFSNVTRSSHGAAGAWLLDEVHSALVALLAKSLGRDAQHILHGRDTQPDHAVLAIWDSAAQGFGAACHFSRLESSTEPTSDAVLEVARKSLRPFLASGEDRVFVASEAFAPLQCWSEGALQMAENALQRLGMKKPPWMMDAIYKEVLFSDSATAGVEDSGFAKRHDMMPQLAVHPLHLLVRGEVQRQNVDEPQSVYA